MADILDFNDNAMCKVISEHTTRSCIPENLKVDTKIMNLLLLRRKLYPFNVCLSQIVAILDFAHNTESKVLMNTIIFN